MDLSSGSSFLNLNEEKSDEFIEELSDNSLNYAFLVFEIKIFP